MENYMNRKNEISEAAEFARTLLVLHNYQWLKDTAAGIGIKIIPLKGIDLLQNLYAEQLDRHANDIDILCTSEEDCRKLVNYLCRKDYHVEFSFAMNPQALTVKRKVSLLSDNPNRVNIDIHTAFVTKKFFSRTIRSFNEDALGRCDNGYMEALDRWLFLAQHAAFHLFAEEKWTIDLRLLYERLTGRQKYELLNRADRYGFRRVTMAACYQIYKNKPQTLRDILTDMHLSASERRFLAFVTFFDRPFSRKAFDRLIMAYWEFPFIARRRDRLASWFRLIFPSKGMLTNIYRIKRPVSRLWFYPLNVLVCGGTGSFFCLLYHTVAVFSKKPYRNLE